MYSLGEWKYKDANAPDGNDSGAFGATTKEKGNTKHYQENIIPQGIKKEGTIVAAHFLLWLYGWWKARG